MASIPYQAKDCHFSQDKGTGDPPPELVAQFLDDARKLITKGDYLRKRWMACYGYRFHALIITLRGFCSYSVKEGEVSCFPSYETIAKACKVSRRSVCYWMQRNEEGKFIHPKYGEALNRFIRVQPRRRYDAKGQCQVQTSNLYLVRMDTPVVPEDDALVWEKAKELAIRALERQAQEQEQEARRQETECRAVRAGAFVERDCTPNAMQKVHSQSDAKSAQDRLSSTVIFYPDTHRSTQGGESAPQAIRNTQNAAYQPTSEEEDEENAHSAASKSKSNGATAQRSEDQFRRAAPSVDKVWERDDARFQAAWKAAGGVISSLLQEYGDAPAVARRDTFKVLRAYLALGAPIERIAPLAYLAREQVTDYKVRGGKILNEAAYYVSTACNLAPQARKKGWDVERTRKANLARPAKPEQQRQETRRPARRAAPRTTRPTPAEAEALVMDLGQQPETYAEAQAQVRQMEERQQAREAQEQAVRQQAQLFSQLGQAEEALKMFPEGSLAWERAQREKQEAERQIAALRKSAGETGATTQAAQPEGREPLARQDRTEREYREAIHSWARAHGWTVRHGEYGGSQRDWQIGLMGVGLSELRTLAAELGA